MFFDDDEQKNEIVADNDISAPPKIETSKDIKIWRKLLLLVTGIGGIFIFSLLATLLVNIFSFEYDEQKIGVINFVTYGLLFLTLLGIVNVDIIKFKNDFNKFLPYLIGFGFGVAMIIFPIIYNLIINSFYESSVNENESSLRNIIAIYPILSLIFFGFLGPICEELTYRVGLFGILKKPKWLAYVIGTLVFALAHFSFSSVNIINELINLPIYIVSGFLMCLAYDKFGLAASLTAHTVNNVYSVTMVIIYNFLNSLVS